jgi:hypothetical protein
MKENRVDDAVEQATEVLEDLLDIACGWFIQQTEKIKEKKEAKKQASEKLVPRQK